MTPDLKANMYITEVVKNIVVMQYYVIVYSEL